MTRSLKMGQKLGEKASEGKVSLLCDVFAIPPNSLQRMIKTFTKSTNESTARLFEAARRVVIGRTIVGKSGACSLNEQSLGLCDRKGGVSNISNCA